MLVLGGAIYRTHSINSHWLTSTPTNDHGQVVQIHSNAFSIMDGEKKVSSAVVQCDKRGSKGCVFVNYNGRDLDLHHCCYRVLVLYVMRTFVSQHQHHVGGKRVTDIPKNRSGKKKKVCTLVSFPIGGAVPFQTILYKKDNCNYISVHTNTL